MAGWDTKTHKEKKFIPWLKTAICLSDDALNLPLMIDATREAKEQATKLHIAAVCPADFTEAVKKGADDTIAKAQQALCVCACICDSTTI